MSKTLTCPGPPPHEFEHAGGRGRPPKYCDNHKPVKASTNSKPKQDEPQGAIPEPDAKPNPFIAKAEKDRKRKKIEPALKAKAERREQDAADREHALEKEFETIDERVEEAFARYDELWKELKSKKPEDDDPKEWAKLGQLQSAAINMNSRKRLLYAHFEKLTDGAQHSGGTFPISSSPTGVYIDDTDPLHQTWEAETAKLDMTKTQAIDPDDVSDEGLRIIEEAESEQWTAAAPYGEVSAEDEEFLRMLEDA